MHPTSRNGLDNCNRLHCAGCAQQVSDERLGGIHFEVELPLPIAGESLGDGAVLRHVPRRRGGGMRVHVVHLRALHASISQRLLNAHGHALAGWVGLRHVVRIARVATPQNLRVNLGSARLGVLQALQHQHARALAHDKAVAVCVPGAGGFLRGVVALGQGFRGAEASHADGDDRRVRRPGKHHVRLAALNVLHRAHDAVVAAGAGGGARVVGAHEAEVHGQQGRAHVCDGERDAEGVHLARTLLIEHLHRRGKRAHAAHGGPDEAATPVLVKRLLLLLLAQAGVLQRLLGRHKDVLDVRVQAARHLGAHVLAAVQVLDLPRKVGGQVRRVKVLDVGDAALAFK
mmetsp:Transcript_4603/g.8709  ORF Transcript_4603/g.8709 Transcript_4603/m.8709 type:complete len:344 (+) Transcript_4603:466-1497(+)